MDGEVVVQAPAVRVAWAAPCALHVIDIVVVGGRRRRAGWCLEDKKLMSGEGARELINELMRKITTFESYELW